MTRREKIRTLRCTLISLLAAALCLVLRTEWSLGMFASFSWTPLGLFMPVFPSGHSCGVTFSACSGSTGPASVQVSIAGFSGTCDAGAVNCSTFDGNYVLDFASETGTLCAYLYAFSTSCNYVSVRAFISATSSGTVVDLQADLFNNTINSFTAWRDPTYAAAPIDCSTISGAPLTLSLNGGACDGTGVTATLSAV